MPYDPDLRRLIGAKGARRVTAMEHRLIEALRRRAGALVRLESLIEALYDVPDDEPEGPHVVIRTLICRIRASLRSLGRPDEIETVRGEGYIWHAGERLRPLCLSPGQRTELLRLIDTHPNARPAARMLDILQGFPSP
jgi:DNA-binding winged helix-turn-helix (wHTH) protein